MRPLREVRRNKTIDYTPNDEEILDDDHDDSNNTRQSTTTNNSHTNLKFDVTLDDWTGSYTAEQGPGTLYETKHRKYMGVPLINAGVVRLGDRQPQNTRQLAYWILEHGYHMGSSIVKRIMLSERDLVRLIILRPKWDGIVQINPPLKNVGRSAGLSALVAHLLSPQNNNTQCNHCDKRNGSKGPFTECIASDDNFWGACTNCQYRGRAADCSLYIGPPIKKRKLNDTTPTEPATFTAPTPTPRAPTPPPIVLPRRQTTADGDFDLVEIEPFYINKADIGKQDGKTSLEKTNSLALHASMLEIVEELRSRDRITNPTQDNGVEREDDTEEELSIVEVRPTSTIARRR